MRAPGPHRRAGAAAHRWHGPGVAGQHGRGAAGDPAGEGRGNGRLPAAAGPEGDHGDRPAAASRGDRRPLPRGVPGPRHTGHHDAHLHRPGGHGGPDEARRRRKGQHRHPRPRRAGGDGGGQAAGPVHHGRGPAGRPGGRQPALAGRPGPRPRAGGDLPGHAGGLRPPPRGGLPADARKGGGARRRAAGPRQPVRAAAGADGGGRGCLPVGACRVPAGPPRRWT